MGTYENNRGGPAVRLHKRPPATAGMPQTSANAAETRGQAYHDPQIVSTLETLDLPVEARLVWVYLRARYGPGWSSDPLGEIASRVQIPRARMRWILRALESAGRLSAIRDVRGVVLAVQTEVPS